MFPVVTPEKMEPKSSWTRSNKNLTIFLDKEVGTNTTTNVHSKRDQGNQMKKGPKVLTTSSEVLFPELPVVVGRTL